MEAVNVPNQAVERVPQVAQQNVKVMEVDVDVECKGAQSRRKVLLFDALLMAAVGGVVRLGVRNRPKGPRIDARHTAEESVAL